MSASDSPRRLDKGLQSDDVLNASMGPRDRKTAENFVLKLSQAVIDTPQKFELTELLEALTTEGFDDGVAESIIQEDSTFRQSGLRRSWSLDRPMWIRSAVTSAPEGYLVEVVGITFTTQFNQFVPQSIQFGVVYADDRWKIVSYAAGPAAPNSDPTLDWSVAELRPELEGEGWREIL